MCAMSKPEAKRFLDLAFTILALPLLLPLMAICALAVKFTSPGPVLFRQKRLGRDAAIFDVLKFRSMYIDSKDIRNADGSTYNSAKDPRVTPVGRWLRKLSLDELPQFINVLRGEMSIVGPRPDLPDAIAHYRPQDQARLQVRPGITGWAQVHGRNTLQWETRRNYDIEYVRTMSTLLDLKIMLLTFVVVSTRSGVYVKAERSHQNEPSRILLEESDEWR
jgi:lipopolysaccharide/colanic/teichoic acid biosynthesis glycosyltransferase